MIAARLAEEFMKPAAVLQVEGDVAKGSVRTFGGIHVLEAMRTMDALLMKYGGHAAAAGLTLATSDIPALQKGLDEALQTIPDEHWENTRTADVWLSPDHVSQEGLAAVRQFEPTGRGHEPIIFVVEADVTSLRWVGADQTHAQVQLAFHNVVHRAMAFQALRLWPWLESGIKIRCYLQLVGNVWQGVERPDLHVVDMEEIKE